MSVKERTSWHQLSENEALSNLKSNPGGLTDEQVEAGRKQVGLNEIPDAVKRSWLRLFLKQFKSILVLILFVAAVVSWITAHYIDIYVILAVIVINSVIGIIQEFRADKAIASLKNMMSPVAKVLRNGEKITIPAKELVPGDIIILEEGDSIPADARIIESKNARTIESALTGESVPVNKHTGSLPLETVLAERKNMLFKTTFLAGGYAKAVVTGTGMQTAIGDIALTLGNIKKVKTNFQKKTDTLAKQMAVIAIFCSAIMFLVIYFLQETPLEEILLISIAILVSVIPEGLPAVLTIVLAIGAHRMSQRNAIMREFAATETLGAVTTIITDKTGTLTQNTLTVRKAGILNEPDIEVTGEGWFPAGNFMINGKVLESEDLNVLHQFLKIAGWSNNSEIKHKSEEDVYQLIGDPTEGALLVLARKGGVTPNKDDSIQKIEDVPFNSELKIRATLIEEKGKKQLLIIGAPEKILEISTHSLSRNGIKPMSNEDKQFLRDKIENWSEDAMRVIGLAYREEGDKTETIDESDFKGFVFAGIAGMIDPPRPDVKEAVAMCKKAGIRVIMATGDHINTAIAVARSTGIISGGDDVQNIAISEKQLLDLDEKEFEDVIMKINVFARLTPNMKLRIAEKLQQRGELIAMTGDGVNDAPALKKADIGIAMGIMGTDVSRDAAKMVLADDNFSTIVSAIEEGRIVFTNARQTSFFLVTTNFAEIITLITAVLMGMPVPLTATQILWLNIVTDGVGDLSLATEKGHGNILSEKPVNPKERILNREIFPFLIINAILMTILTLGAFYTFLPVSLEKARSAAFIMMAFTQLFNIFNMRSLKLSIFKIGMFSNKYVNIALFVSVLIQIMLIEIPFFEKLFRFDPISLSEFIILGLLASVVLWVGEIYKYVRYVIMSMN